VEFTTDFLASVAGFEGSTDYMYQDTSGHVTIGVGHLIASPELAAALPFTGKSTSFQDWCRVKRALRGKPAAYYKRCSSSRLAPRAVANLLQADLDATVAQLTAGLPCFATLPGEAQKALCDMAGNLSLGASMCGGRGLAGRSLGVPSQRDLAGEKCLVRADVPKCSRRIVRYLCRAQHQTL
jgi:GH24 family phage-related lysozyme (muramidase)